MPVLTKKRRTDEAEMIRALVPSGKREKALQALNGGWKIFLEAIPQ